MFCTRDLGRNEVIEAFPVGRKLAFDREKGRLWVVCGRCAGWNLTPLEERWEAVEDCEKRFREARTRTSTGELGLARLAEGLELVRVGRPLRPEFAAWRYADRFVRRRRGALIGGAGLAAAGGVAMLGSFAAGAGALPLVGYLWWSQQRTVTRLRTPEDRLLEVRGSQLEHAFLTREPSPGSGGASWGISVPYRGGRERFSGNAAAVATARLLRGINRTGATLRTTSEAVGRIEQHGDPETFLRELSRTHAAPSGDAEFTLVGWRRLFESGPHAWSWTGKTVKGSLARLPAPERLALEMALHEESERRAMEGELRLLEHQWRDAEAVAAIADGLLPPPGAERFIARHSDPGVRKAAERRPAEDA